MSNTAGVHPPSRLGGRRGHPARRLQLRRWKLLRTSCPRTGTLRPQATVWTCPDCEHTWRSRVEFDAVKGHVADLVGRAADEDDDALKELTALLKAHAVTHRDTTLFEAPIVRVGTDAYIVDPMHCLELNLAKTA
eukprot:2486360-Pleurochrysis_carterae.AAC.4